MLTRILSAAVLAPPLLYLILKGTPFYFFLLMLPVSAILLHEWQGLNGNVAFGRWLVQVMLSWVLLCVSYFGLDVFVLPLVALALFVMIAAMVFNYHPGKNVILLWSVDFTGLVYCAIPLLLLMEIQDNLGGHFVIMLLLIIWATDSGAYFFGKFFGKKKLAPVLSPGKTWVGFYGGCASGLLAGAFVSSFFSLDLLTWQAMLIGILLSLSGQLGDLAESMLKREAGVKDSGRLIPGHGGLLDRLDSLLFASPVYYLLLTWMTNSMPLTEGGFFAG